MARVAMANVFRRRRNYRGRSEPAGALVHCAHHKVGTVWWGNILRGLAEHCALRFAEVTGADFPDSADVYLYHHSRHFERLHFTGKPLRGTHMVRDPRDVLVSGYFYHLWTEERWANVPDSRFDGRSYREELNRRDRHDGLLLEMERMFDGHLLREMLEWDYAQPEFLELRYEDVLLDEVSSFDKVFRHFDLRDRDVKAGLAIVEQMSFRRVAGRDVGVVSAGTHLRSGRPGEWREHLTIHHLQRWRELAGDDVLTRLGYDPNY